MDLSFNAKLKCAAGACSKYLNHIQLQWQATTFAAKHFGGIPTKADKGQKGLTDVFDSEG